MTPGEIIYKLRTEKNLTRDDIVMKSEGAVKANAIFRIETGKTKELRARQLNAIAKVLGVKPSVLRGEEPVVPRQVLPAERLRAHTEVDKAIDQLGVDNILQIIRARLRQAKQDDRGKGEYS